MTGAGSFTITRNAQNGLPESVSDGTLTNTRTFSSYGELDSNSYSIGGTNRYSYTLIRDLAGRITQKTEIVDGSTDTYNYAYDANGRLNEVKKNNSVVETYTYDANGNRLTETNTLRGVNRSYTVSNEDHIITAGTETYQFNMDGFLTSKTSGSNTSAYQYSSRGELLSTTLSGSTAITYDHDPMGRRIAKRVNGTITEKYLWKDAITLLATFDANNNLVMRFNYADGRMPVSMTYNESSYYLFYDQVGSLRAVTDTSGNIIKKIDYDSFGSIISDTNPGMNIPFGFAGGLQDRDTGLVRFGARDYDPALGRWTAKDPIDFSGGDTNLYGYVLNKPLNRIDPSGLCPGDKQKCIQNFLQQNYGNFVANTLIPEFSGISIFTNFWDFAKGSAISAVVKGALVGLPGLASKLATTTGNNLAAYPGMAGAAADALETGAFWGTTATTASQALAVGVTAAFFYSTTADVYARLACWNVND